METSKQHQLAALLRNKVDRTQATSWLIDPDLSDEQKALVAASADAHKLTAKPAFAGAVSCLLTARRMYAVAAIELQRLLENERQEKTDLHPMVEDVLVQSAMHKAAEPFDENDLMEGLMVAVLPWLGHVVDSHNEADAAEAAIVAQKEEEDRLARPVPIGFAIDPGDDLAMPRHRSITLVGPVQACRFVAVEAVNSVLTERQSRPFTVLWLTTFREEGSQPQPRLLRLTPNEWNGCGNSNKSFDTVVATKVTGVLSTTPDLLVVDDLSACYTKSFFGRPSAASAGDAHQRLSNWCKRKGCALLALIPTEGVDDVDTTRPEFEQLKTFSRLRPLLMRRMSDETVRIQLGGGLTHWDTTIAVLESLQPRKVVTA